MAGVHVTRSMAAGGGGRGSAPHGGEKDKKGSVRGGGGGSVGGAVAGGVMSDTVKLIAESVGVGALHEDALQLLADDATYR